METFRFDKKKLLVELIFESTKCCVEGSFVQEVQLRTWIWNQKSVAKAVGDHNTLAMTNRVESLCSNGKGYFNQKF